MGLVARRKKAFVPKTTVSDPDANKSDRLFRTGKGEKKITELNRVWCSDLTYLRFSQRFLYSVVYLDVCSREIKSWELSSDMGALHTRRAFLRATKEVPGNLNGLIVHSDQGSQYSASKYKKALKDLDAKQSKLVQ